MRKKQLSEQDEALVAEVDSLLREPDALAGPVDTEERPEDALRRGTWEARRAELESLRAERDRYREHSITLNTISWRIASALGDVPEGADQIEGYPVERADRLIRERDEARAELERAHAALRGGMAAVLSLAPAQNVELRVECECRDRCGEAERERDAALAELVRVRATLGEVLGGFHERGHPGYEARRSGWVAVERIERWRAVLAGEQSEVPHA